MHQQLHACGQFRNAEHFLRLTESAFAVYDDSNWHCLKMSWPVDIGAVIVGNKKLGISLLSVLQEVDCFLSGLSFSERINLLVVNEPLYAS